MAFLGQRGQVSIEFILIVVIALIYITGVVWPAVERSSRAAEDIKAVADAKLSSMKLAQALNEAAVSSGDMRKTINVFLPPNSEILCNFGSDEISYDVLVDYINAVSNPDPTKCTAEPPLPAPTTDWKCSSSVKLLSRVAILGGSCPSMKTGEGNRLFKRLIVEKALGVISVRWE